VNKRSSIFGLIVATAVTGPVLAQSTYNWTHGNNNNWDNAGNWSGASGYPNSPTDSANFDSSHYGFLEAEVDTRGQTFDVDHIIMTNADEAFTFLSSDTAPGMIRLHGDFLFDNNFANEVAPHDFEVNLEVVGNGTWTAGSTQYLDFSGVLSGSGTITAQANAAGAGELHSRWRGANTFDGTLIIDNVFLSIDDPNAFQYADVVINHNNGFRIYGFSNQTIHVASLSGTGLLDFLGNDFVTTSDADTTFSGTLKSTSGSSAIRNFTKTGAGTLTLSGQVTSFGALINTGNGGLNVDGGGDIQILEVRSGEVNVRGQALDLGSEAANTFFMHNDGTARVENGAVVTLTGIAGSNRMVLTNDAVLSVQDSGSTLVTPRLDIGPSGAGSAEALAQLGGLISADRIRVGDLGSDDGAGGQLIANNGLIDAGDTILYRRGSILIFGGGTLATNTLADGDTEAHTISIADSGAPALTIGVSDGSSVVDALIGDFGLGSGSLRKVGAGTLELRSANTYSAGTTIDGGTLLASNTSGSATGSGDVTVNAGGTLSGAGTVSGGIIYVEDGGTLAPGDSIGQLTSGGDVFFRSGSTLAIEIGGVNKFDRLVLDNTVASVGPGALDLTYANGFTAAPGDSFQIISGGVSGNFHTVSFPDDQTWIITKGNNTFTVAVCADADTDGVCDVEDVCPGFDDSVDADNDGVPDGCDVCPGFVDALDADTDGVPDGCDQCTGFDDAIDVNDNGIPDGCDAHPIHNRTQGTDYVTLQSAIDASIHGDLIEADPGIYHEAIDIGNRSLTLQSSSGDPRDTIIDGGGNHHVVQSVDSNVLTKQLQGLTFTGGNASGSGNDAMGGGMFCKNLSIITVRRCIFRGNSATSGGALACVNSSAPTVVDCLFADNASTGNGGAALVTSASLPEFVNCTFARNHAAGRGGAIAVPNLAHPELRNCIAWDNSDSTGANQFHTGPQIGGGMLTARYSDIMGGRGGVGNIQFEPRFVDPDGPDDVAGNADDDFSLAGGSPCIDAADHAAYINVDTNAIDLAGNPRPQDDPGTDDTGAGALAYLDMGAFEFQGTTECGAGGDFGNDGAVDLIDHARFANCLSGPSGGLGPNCACFDLDADGDVDMRDFAAFEVGFTGN